MLWDKEFGGKTSNESTSARVNYENKQKKEWDPGWGKKTNGNWWAGEGEGGGRGEGGKKGRNT